MYKNMKKVMIEKNAKIMKKSKNHDKNCKKSSKNVWVHSDISTKQTPDKNKSMFFALSLEYNG